MGVHDWTRVPAGIVHHFHHEWISAMSRSLNDGLLPTNFYALDEQIVSDFGPDVLALEIGRPISDDDARPFSGDSVETGGVALAEPKVQFASDEDLSYTRRKRVVVRHVSGHKVVAVIEIISPGNKASELTADRFVRKSIELLDRGIHLLVVDVLPPTPPNPKGFHDSIWGEYSSEAFSPPPGKLLVASSYCAAPPRRAFAHAISVGEDFPDMPLYLSRSYWVPAPLARTYAAAWRAVPSYWRDSLESEPPADGGSPLSMP